MQLVDEKRKLVRLLARCVTCTLRVALGRRACSHHISDWTCRARWREFFCTLIVLTFSALNAMSQTTVSFSSASYEVYEYGQFGAFIVLRSGDLGIAAEVDFSTADLSAVSGTDYDALTTTVRFASGEAEKVIHVRITDDAIDGFDRIFNGILQNPGFGVSIGALSAA